MKIEKTKPKKSITEMVSFFNLWKLVPGFQN